jgi:hypothetical protein
MHRDSKILQEFYDYIKDMSYVSSLCNHVFCFFGKDYYCVELAYRYIKKYRPSETVLPHLYDKERKYSSFYFVRESCTEKRKQFVLELIKIAETLERKGVSIMDDKIKTQRRIAPIRNIAIQHPQ